MRCCAKRARSWSKAFATSCSSRANIRNLSPTVISPIACARSTRRYPASRSKSARWKRRNTVRSSPRARKAWSFTRKLTTAKFTRACTPPARSAISTGASKQRSALTLPAFAVSASARFLDWAIGAAKRWPSPRTLPTCFATAGKRRSPFHFPRLRPCAGEFEPLTELSDRELVQLVCALRLFLPDVGIVLSTREPANLRDGLLPLGITLMSAGSHTEPGGYTGAGAEKIHLTERGRIVELAGGASEWSTSRRRATGQFDIADDRSPEEIAERDRKARLRTGVEGLGCGARFDMSRSRTDQLGPFGLTTGAVVIALILVAFVYGSVVGRRRARRAQITIDLVNFTSALMAYSNHFGALPVGNNAAVTSESDRQQRVALNIFELRAAFKTQLARRIHGSQWAPVRYRSDHQWSPVHSTIPIGKTNTP